MPNTNLSSAFRGKHVFLTGHTGFKGSWLALWLNHLGAHVHGYALAPDTTPSLFDDLQLQNHLASHTLADIRDPARLTTALQKSNAEIIFHLAAQPLVRRSYAQPRDTFETNIMGTVNLLEAIRQTPSARVAVIVTSDKCYENREQLYPYREDDAMGGADPYSNSKGCAELITAAYRHSFFHPSKIDQHHVSLSSARAGNVIGGGDWAQDRIIPDCIRALQKNEPIGVRNPTSIRPWQHVLEPLSGYLTLAAHQLIHRAHFSTPYNFGPAITDALPVRDIANQVVTAWGSGTWTDLSHTTQSSVLSPQSSLHEAKILRLDITKAVTTLHWQPTWNVQSAVAHTIAWYRARHTAGPDFSAHAFTLDQIQKFTTASHRNANA